MAATASTMLPLGTPAPDFHLPDATTGRLVSRGDFAGSPALLVMFLGNHCPYVKHVAEELVRLAREYQERGAGVVAISSNDVAQYPEDGPARMAEVAAAMGATFPYLYDETQAVAKAHHAACTPDFFGPSGPLRSISCSETHPEPSLLSAEIERPTNSSPAWRAAAAPATRAVRIDGQAW